MTKQRPSAEPERAVSAGRAGAAPCADLGGEQPKVRPEYQDGVKAPQIGVQSAGGPSQDHQGVRAALATAGPRARRRFRLAATTMTAAGIVITILGVRAGDLNAVFPAATILGAALLWVAR